MTVFFTLHVALVPSYKVQFTLTCHTVNGKILAPIWMFYVQHVHSYSKTMYISRLKYRLAIDNKHFQT